MKILFMCVANSARSQLAEGIAKSIFPSGVEIQSAGSNPSQVNPLAIKVMQEIGIDISKQFAKTVKNLPLEFLASLNYVITLCAEEVCPVLPSNAKKLHWPMPDPASNSQTSLQEQVNLFRKTRDSLKEKLIAFKNELSL